MGTIYFKDNNGKKVQVEVSDELEQAYREELRAEWRNNAYEAYHSNVSIEAFAESGYEFSTDDYNAFDEENDSDLLKFQLKTAWPHLTELQQKTLYKIFF